MRGYLHSSIALRPAVVILMRTTSIALSPAFMFSRRAIASPLLTRPAIMSLSNPRRSTRSSSVAPSGSLARSCSASRCSALRRRSVISFNDLRVSLGEGRLGLIEGVGHPAVWGRRRHGLQEPAPFHLPMDRLPVNPADPRFINDGIVVFARVDRLAPFDSILCAHLAEDERHRLYILRGRAGCAGGSFSPSRCGLPRPGLTLSDGAAGFLPGVPLSRSIRCSLHRISRQGGFRARRLAGGGDGGARHGDLHGGRPFGDVCKPRAGGFQP